MDYADRAQATAHARFPDDVPTQNAFLAGVLWAVGEQIKEEQWNYQTR